MLNQNINKAQKAQGTPAAKEAENVTAMALDLLLLMLSYLSSADATALFNICLAGDILESKDNAVQKRGYKVLAKLVEGGKVDVNADDILKRLDGVADGLAAAAKKVQTQGQMGAMGATPQIGSVAPALGAPATPAAPKRRLVDLD